MRCLLRGHERRSRVAADQIGAQAHRCAGGNGIERVPVVVGGEGRWRRANKPGGGVRLWGEGGYVKMQCTLAEHQDDPLITQYVGSAILRLLQSTDIDTEALQRQVQQQQL